MSARDHKQPYVRFFASDWLAGTRGMRAAEIGVYITLISLMYERCEPLPEDSKRLARQCGCDPRGFMKSLESLIADRKIIRTDSGLWNERVQKEFDFRGKKSSTAKEAADARWKKDKENNDTSMRTHSECNADAMPYQKPEARSQKEKSSPSESPKTRPRGTRLPEDWKPEANACSELELLPSLETVELPKFRDYWRAQPGARGVKLDWDATWRNWLRRAAERAPSVKASNLPPGIRRNGSGFYVSHASPEFPRIMADAERLGDNDTYWACKKAEREKGEVHVRDIWPRRQST